MAKVAQSSNAAASPIMGPPSQAEFTSPAHAKLLEKFQTESAKLGEEFRKRSQKVAEEFERKLKHLAQFDEYSSCSTSSSSSEHTGSDSEPDDDDNGDEGSLSPSADTTRVFRVDVPKLKPLVNGNSLKNSTKLEPKEKKKKKPTVNGISKTDTSESLVSAGLDLSQKAGGMLLNGGTTNGDSEITDRKERVRSSKLDYKRLDELYV